MSGTAPTPPVEHHPLPIIRKVRRGVMTFDGRCACGFLTTGHTKLSSVYVVLDGHLENHRAP